MKTESHLEPGEGWGARGEEWGRLERLVELIVSRRTGEGFTEERRYEEQRERIRARVLARLEERDLAQRRRAHILVAGASALLLVGLVVMVVRRS